MKFDSILDAGFMKDIKEKSKLYIIEERARYKTVYETIEKYCEENKLMRSSSLHLVEKGDSFDLVYKKEYLIYTAEPLKHANNLTNAIYVAMEQHPEKRFTRLKTIQEKREFVVEYDFRPLVTVYKVQKYENGEPYKIINCELIDKQLYLPSEIELIDVYHTMHDPSQADKVDDIIEVEPALYNKVCLRKEKGILGGSCVEDKKKLIEFIKLQIVQKWLVQQKDLVLIGSWAYDIHKVNGDLNAICTNPDKIQFCSIDDADIILESLKKFIAEYCPNRVTYREQDLQIPKDFRTSRFTFYLSVETPQGIKEKPFLDWFNCMTFEIIPSWKLPVVLDGEKSSLNFGSKTLMLRFLFIDLWILRLVKYLGYFTKEVLDEKINVLWSIVEYIKDKYTDGELQFTGEHRPYMMDKKITNLQGKRYFPYYPHNVDKLREM
jgi:hypothetical protein